MELPLLAAGLARATPRVRLQQALALVLSSKGDLKSALQAPLDARAAVPAFEALCEEAVLGGSSVESCAELAAFLLAPGVGDREAGAEAGEAGGEAGVAETFHHAALAALKLRFLALSSVNSFIGKDLLPTLDVGVLPGRPQSELLGRMKPLLLGHLKYARFQQILGQTVEPAELAMVTLDLASASAAAARGSTDWGLRESVFSQLYRELLSKRVLPHAFRQKWQAKAFKIAVRCDSEDVAGLYHRVFEAMAVELHSKVLPLLTPCPNAKNRRGGGRDLWVLNPRAAMPEYVQVMMIIINIIMMLLLLLLQLQQQQLLLLMIIMIVIQTIMTMIMMINILLLLLLLLLIIIIIILILIMLLLLLLLLLMIMIILLTLILSLIMMLILMMIIKSIMLTIMMTMMMMMITIIMTITLLTIIMITLLMT